MTRSRLIIQALLGFWSNSAPPATPVWCSNRSSAISLQESCGVGEPSFHDPVFPTSQCATSQRCWKTNGPSSLVVNDAFSVSLGKAGPRDGFGMCSPRHLSTPNSLVATYFFFPDFTAATAALNASRSPAKTFSSTFATTADRISDWLSAGV